MHASVTLSDSDLSIRRHRSLCVHRSGERELLARWGVAQGRESDLARDLLIPSQIRLPHEDLNTVDITIPVIGLLHGPPPTASWMTLFPTACEPLVVVAANRWLRILSEERSASREA